MFPFHVLLTYAGDNVVPCFISAMNTVDALTKTVECLENGPFYPSLLEKIEIEQVS